MLRARHARGDGFTLVELMVVLAISAFLMVLMLRAYAGWSADYKVRASAESLLAAVRQAQATAVAHNRFTALVFTNSAPSWIATPSSSGTSWVAMQLPLSGSDDNFSASSVLTANSAAAGAGLAITASASSGATTSTLCFNALGQLASTSWSTASASGSCTAPSDATPVAYTVSGTNQGSVRQLRVLVYPSGQTRLCDALKTLSAQYPDGCPAS